MASASGALLERDLETAHLQRAVDHSWHGVGRLVVIEGPAGIGKTSLIGSARELAAAAGMNVRIARGSELERSFAFGIVRQMFEPLLADADAAQREDWLAGAAGLAAPVFETIGPPPGEPEDSVYPRLHGLYWMCSNISRKRPLALCIDDAHLGDQASLSFIEFLARRLDELPILIIVAVRSRVSEVPDALATLFADPTARVLTPRGLSAHAVRQVVAEQIGSGVDEQFAGACRDATSGNPFLLGELIRSLHDAGIEPVRANTRDVGALGPERVAGAVLGRLGRLSPSAVTLARSIAILGDGASVANAATLAGLDHTTAITAAAVMRANDLLDDAVRFTFAHPIIRSAIYQSILPAEREVRHAEAAALLYGRGAPAEQVAAQLLRADDSPQPWIFEQLRLAADSALAMGAPASAASYLRRALDLSSDGSDPALLAALGRAEVLAGLPEAAGHLDEAVRLASDPDQRARIAVSLAQLLKYTGRVPAAVELLSGLPPAVDPALTVQVETEMLSGALMSYTAHELLKQRLQALRDPGTEARTERERVELVVLAFEELNANRDRTTVRDLLMRAGTGPKSPDETVLLPPALMTTAATFSYIDEFERAHAICTMVAERSRRRGSQASLLIALGLRAQNAYRRGDLAEAQADAETAYRIATDVAAVSEVLALHPLATINNVAVEQERAVAELEELLEITDRSINRDTLHVGLTLLSRARLLVALGRAQEALEQLLELGGFPAAFATGVPAFLAWRSDAAAVMHQLGDQQGALELASEELALARAMGIGRATGIALRAFALVHEKPSVELLDEAVAVLEQSGARLDHARALVDVGAVMRRAGERSASRVPLREGHDLAVMCGATKLAERARREIAASGARVAQPGVDGVASLTPSERRVAELAADGLTNRDIAQALYITEKTVETHLGHAYDKLDIRSRHRLAELLAQPDPA